MDRFIFIFGLSILCCLLCFFVIGQLPPLLHLFSCGDSSSSLPSSYFTSFCCFTRLLSSFHSPPSTFYFPPPPFHPRLPPPLFFHPPPPSFAPPHQAFHCCGCIRPSKWNKSASIIRLARWLNRWKTKKKQLNENYLFKMIIDRWSEYKSHVSPIVDCSRIFFINKKLFEWISQKKKQSIGLGTFFME